MLVVLIQSMGVDDPVLPPHPFPMDVILRANKTNTSRARDCPIHLRWNGRRSDSAVIAGAPHPRNAGTSPFGLVARRLANASS